MKQLISKFKSTILVFMAAVLSLSLVSPAMSVYAASGEYVSGDSTIALDVELSGSSTNDHTMPYKLWSNGDRVYVAVKSTHGLEHMTLNDVMSSGMDMDTYDALANIKIDGVSYAPDGLSGSTNKSHWTVFSFPLSSMADSSTANYFIKGIGGGHDVGGYFKVIIPTVTVNVAKTWVDGPMHSVKVQIYRQIADGAKKAYGYPITLSVENNTITLSDLAYTDNIGRVYVYSFEEADAGEGYDVTYTSSYDPATFTYTFQLTNKYTSPKIPVVAKKEWVNGDAASRPTIHFELWRKNGTAGEGEKVVNATVVANDQVDFGQQDKSDVNGVIFDYYVKEIDAEGNNLAPDNYTMVESGLTVTNTYTSPKTPIVAKKEWVNGDAAKRPTIYFELWRKNGTAGEGEKVVNATVVANNQVDFGNQDETDINGVTYSYYVKEVNAQGDDFTPENYTKLENGLTVTNTYEIPKTDITGNKVWVDGPEVKPTIQLQLYQGDVTYGAPVTLENGTVEYTWKNLDKTDKDGKVHVYTVKEVGVPENYTKAESGLTVTNTYKSPKANVTAKKIWDGGPAVKPMIQFQLYQGDKVFGEVVTLFGTSTYTWYDLDQTDSQGVDHVYSVKEVTELPNYTSTPNGLEITNTYVIPKDGEVTATKVWNGGPNDRPTVWFQLHRQIDGGQVVAVPGAEIKELVSGVETVKWSGLETTDFNGNQYTFSVTEVDASGADFVPVNYEKTQVGLSVTNKYVVPKTDVTAHKVWVNGPKVKPEVTLELYRGSELQDTVILADGETSYIWEGLDKTDFDGNEYVYTIKEKPVANYQPVYSEDGLTVTNLYVSPLIDVTATKMWEGGPVEKPMIQFQLYQGDKVFGEVVTLFGANTYTWHDLDQTDSQGVDHVYSVKEITELSDYIKVEDGLTVTNTYSSPVTDVSVVKQWVDDFTSHPAVEVALLRDGEVVETATLSEANDWVYIWKDVALNDNEGNPYTYAVEELEVPQSYVASVEGSVEDGFIVTNTYFEPGKGGGEVITPVTPELAETGVSMYTTIVGGVLLLGIGMQLLPIRRKYDS